MIGNEPFAVILPDDVIAAEKPFLQQMIEAYEETGGSMVAVMEVPGDQTSSFGILDVEKQFGDLLPVKQMVEKPIAGTEPSNLAVIGWYLLKPSVMENIGNLKAGSGGEIQLTDAIAQEIKEGRPVNGFRFYGCRFDCGSKAGFLKATISFALARSDLRAELMDYMYETMVTEKAAQ